MANIKLAEIAEEINRYLRDFELNHNEVAHGGRKYYCTRCFNSGRYVMVQYISYQGTTSLTKDEAIRYLEWLRAGNIGKHWSMNNG